LDERHHPNQERIHHGAECVKGGENTPYSSSGYDALHSLSLYSSSDIKQMIDIASPVLCKMRYDEDVFKLYTNDTILSQIDCKKYENDKVDVFSQGYIDY